MVYLFLAQQQGTPSAQSRTKQQGADRSRGPGEEEELELSDIEDEDQISQEQSLVLPIYGRNSRQSRRRRRRGDTAGVPHPRHAKRLLGPHILSYPKDIRLQHMTKIVIQTKEETFSRHRCKSCWLLERHCLCDGLVPVSLPMDFSVLLHYKEFLRISNSGHLLALAHPGSRLLVEGKEDDEQKLSALEAAAVREPYSVVVLMPCAGSLSISELKQRREESGTTGRLHVILLDGTWRQARALNRRVSEKVVRVRVEVTEKPTMFRLRTRTRADGISTLEAALSLVEEWGQEGRQEGEAGVAEMLRLLGVHNERVLVASGKPAKVGDRLVKHLYEEKQRE